MRRTSPALASFGWFVLNAFAFFGVLAAAALVLQQQIDAVLLLGFLSITGAACMHILLLAGRTWRNRGDQ